MDLSLIKWSSCTSWQHPRLESSSSPFRTMENINVVEGLQPSTHLIGVKVSFIHSHLSPSFFSDLLNSSVWVLVSISSDIISLLSPPWLAAMYNSSTFIVSPCCISLYHREICGKIKIVTQKDESFITVLIKREQARTTVLTRN